MATAKSQILVPAQLQLKLLDTALERRLETFPQPVE